MSEQGSNWDLRNILRHLIPSLGLNRHYAGPFLEQICDYLAKKEPITLTGGGTAYPTVDGIDLGKNLFHEEINIRFRLLAMAPPKDHVISWGESPASNGEFSYSISPDIQPGEVIGQHRELFFTFTSSIPVEENISAFTQFVGEQSLLSGQASGVEKPRPVSRSHDSKGRRTAK